MDAVQLLNGYEDAWKTGDLDVIVGSFAEHAVYGDAALGEEYRGRDAIRPFLATTFVAFSGFGVDWSRRVLASDGGYALEWTMRGTHTGELIGLPATGRSMAVKGASVGWLRDGAIEQNTDYWNLTDLLTQLGLTPQ